MKSFPLLCLITLSAAPLAAQAAQSDGTVTVEAGTRSATNYPPLPPNSDDIVYDDGIFTGSSRNLQNAGINPGWPYWAHQVRFTPTPAMTGILLEVRYVAATQWGTTTDFDLVIRNSSGVVQHTLPNQTAVIDSNNWQVIDVSSLGFVPGGSDFFVEIRPTNACNGVNGFTIPFTAASPGTGRSRFSDDCTNPQADFLPEAREQFIRAVVRTGCTLTADVTPAQANANNDLFATCATPGGRVLLAGGKKLGSTAASACGLDWGIKGAREFPAVANGSGTATVVVFVPAKAAGFMIPVRAIDVTTCTQSAINMIQF